MEIESASLGIAVADGSTPLTRKASFIGTLNPRTFSYKQGHAKILDFGLAKLSYPYWERCRANRRHRLESHLTTPERNAGTVDYMSPEQVRAKEFDAEPISFPSALSCTK